MQDKKIILSQNVLAVNFQNKTFSIDKRQIIV